MISCVSSFFYNPVILVASCRVWPTFPAVLVIAAIGALVFNKMRSSIEKKEVEPLKITAPPTPKPCIQNSSESPEVRDPEEELLIKTPVRSPETPIFKRPPPLQLTRLCSDITSKSPTYFEGLALQREVEADPIELDPPVLGRKMTTRRSLMVEKNVSAGKPPILQLLLDKTCFQPIGPIFSNS